MLQQTNMPSTTDMLLGSIVTTTKLAAEDQQRRPQVSPTKAVRLQASRWMSCSSDDVSPRSPSHCRSGARGRWQSSDDLSEAAVESSRRLPSQPSRRHQSASSCSSTLATASESRWSSSSSSSSSSSELSPNASLSRPIRRGSIVAHNPCGVKLQLNYAATPKKAVATKVSRKMTWATTA